LGEDCINGRGWTRNEDVNESGGVGNMKRKKKKKKKKKSWGWGWGWSWG
jgi:hypothetical protein